MPGANRLAQEASPYLLQHAGNPVDWWPWSAEAFAEARRRDVPVLISVGYSACHWCHVMAHESFEDTGVAEVLNSGFVAVKVDREERPDVDAVYMEAVQLLTGAGGWPMTVLALADGRPFWGGTYLPRANFLSLLRPCVQPLVDQAGGHRGRRRPARRRGAPRGGATGRWRVRTGGPGANGPDADGTSLKANWKEPRCPMRPSGLLSRYDPQWGGFGAAPKFPQATSLEVLAQYWWRSGDERALDALSRTLDAMSSGGIYDHLAGGFARYSTDRHWLVPHFEKMLYDNALLVLAYTHAWQLTGSTPLSPGCRRNGRATYSARLSACLKVPGLRPRTPTARAKRAVFTPGRCPSSKRSPGPAAALWYGASAAGNWEGTNILWRPRLADIARPPEIEAARLRLLERRQTRPRPGLDGKVLTEWNAMGVAALAYAGTAFGQAEWVAEAAKTAAVFAGPAASPGWALAAVVAAGSRRRPGGHRPSGGRDERQRRRRGGAETCWRSPATTPG